MQTSSAGERLVGATVRVGNASTGVEYAVALASSDLAVDELRDEVARLSGIPPQDQILLGGPPFARLDPRRAIDHYGLPSSEKQVFLYDRRLLTLEAPPAPATQLTPAHFEMPSQPAGSSEGSRMLSESSSPLLRALAEYESHFQLQVSQSEALEHGSKTNIDACEQCARELHVQANAIGAAISNLDLFKASMMKHFAPFWEDFEASSKRHSRLLNGFDEYLSRLSTVKLHPVLATPERQTLYDCIPVDKEREWAAQCQQSHEHVRTQVLRLQEVHDGICREVNDLLSAQDQTLKEYADAKELLAEMKRFSSQQAEISAKLKENLAFVTRSIADTSSKVNVGSMMLASTNALEVCRGIDVLYQKQQNMLPQAQKLSDELASRVEKMAAAKASVLSAVHSTLRKISVSQTKIRDFENSLAMFKEALAAQKKHFNELEHLDKLPESYVACLKEIARRLQYGRKFSDRIQSMAEELAHLREQEVQKREVFLRNYGQHLPRDFVPGLAEKPSHCEFRMRPFDQNLPQLEEDTALNDAASEGKAPASNEAGSSGDTPKVDVDGLQKRCSELEAHVAQLTLELEQSKKFYGSGSESIARSDLSKGSARDGDSSCEFPLALALAATAGAMTSSSEADRSHLLERELHNATVARERDNQHAEKDAVIAKLENENQQFLLNAAAFEEEIQERSKRETHLQEAHNNLQRTIQSLRFSIDVQRSSLVKVMKLLQLPVSGFTDDVDMEAFVTTNMAAIELRVHDLLASADAEKYLRKELEDRQDELSLLETEHDVQDSFKISFRSFTVNDLALFLPTSAPGSDSQRVYLAFHLGCPHRFLSAESISSFSNEGARYPDYVVGRIVLIDEQVATEDHNPYGLHLNTVFYVLTVASLHES